MECYGKSKYGIVSTILIQNYLIASVLRCLENISTNIVCDLFVFMITGIQV